MKFQSWYLYSFKVVGGEGALAADFLGLLVGEPYPFNGQKVEVDIGLGGGCVGGEVFGELEGGESKAQGSYGVQVNDLAKVEGVDDSKENRVGEEAIVKEVRET